MTCWVPVRPYVQLVFLDQGWNFFAPEPGPSTLVSYRAETSTGKVIEGRIPNKRIKPRLFYHRHFMLTSYMGYQQEDVQEVLCEGFIDHIEAWSVNEITINWNAPLAWIAAFLDENGR